MARFDFLKEQHPTYKQCVEDWKRQEARLHGGRIVLEELRVFDWEEEGGNHFKARQNEAVYPKYPDRLATILVGHLFRQAPIPSEGLSFGKLGEVRRVEAIDIPTPAELTYFNTDGRGNDGSQWDAFWGAAAKNAVATGHRWIETSGPPRAPLNRLQELEGLRPYLREHSPVSVPNWDFIDGQLKMAVIKRHVRNLRLEDGALVGNEGEAQYLLMVGRGYTAFDSVLPGISQLGGWVIVNADLENIEAAQDYRVTGGEIPLIPLFYERKLPSEEDWAMSRSGTEEVGNAAVSYMNLSSAADYDAWDAASSVIALSGLDEEGFNLFIQKVKGGTKYAPLKRAMDATQNPEVHDASLGAVTAQVFTERLTAKDKEVVQLMMNEMQSAPYASGTSKQMTWTDTRAPRLTFFASELEGAQNASIRWLEQYWGKREPSGVVHWTKKFDLLGQEEVSKMFFDMQVQAGIHSRTLDRKILVAVAKRNGFIVDDAEEQTIIDELQNFQTPEDKKLALEEKKIQAMAANRGGPVSVQRQGKGQFTVSRIKQP